MKKIEFVKYNRTRREEFQIKTVIARKDGTRTVEKWALREEGISHIASLADKYEKLSAQNPRLNYVQPSIGEEGRFAGFDFIDGTTLDEKLGREIAKGGDYAALIKSYLDLILELKDGLSLPFQSTEEFEHVFGRVEGLEDLAAPVSNVDALFENMMEKDGRVWCLDYEWVFSFPVPLSFLKFRILYYFYKRHGGELAFSEAEEFLEAFGLSREKAVVFLAMEQNFQDYVHGENQQIYLLNYMGETEDFSNLEKLARDFQQVRERNSQLQAEMEQRDLMLRKIREEKRLTDNHVANLEVMIGDLRREITNMAETITYLNRHESLVFKVRRRLGAAFNKRYPKGSRKRKLFLYKVDLVRHPVKAYRMRTTAEGRNMMDGDLEIGDSYRLHGRLVFAREESPLVSIIIPVYNQIGYTYDCLASILEHTADASYEVIIADDVSTDATARLSDFVSNVTICRNETNQGFLKNCNQAARAARGKYLMFLNNDTQVTPGWLSSLVSLAESDPAIGMTGSKLVYPDGRLQEAGGIIWSDGSGWNYGRLDDPDKPEYNYVKDVDYISGAAILISRELWEKIGGFDERYAPAYCEDSDLAFEVRKAGYRVVYQPLSKVIHFEGVSNGTDVNGGGLKRYQVENSRKLREKWAPQLKEQFVNNGNPDPFRARERSKGKPIILVVDHYVPTYDRDAGSKTTFQYIKMFLRKGFVVKFLGDNFLHEEPYSTALQQMGVEILYGRDYQAGIWDWLKDHGDDIAVAYLNRPHIASRYIDYIREKTKCKVIYYGHDLHFMRESRECELTGDPEKRKAALYWKSVEFSIMRKADVSYYPSYVEREAVKAEDASIPVKDIVAYVYEEFPEHIDDDYSQRAGLLFVGGFAHPPNADGVLWFAREIYPAVREKTGAPFFIVGSGVTEEIKALEEPGNGITVKGFVEEEELARLYATSKVVVVPLRYGAGVKGKVIEALYYGSVIVTTSVGAEGIHGAKEVMAVEDEPGKFAEAVSQLYLDATRCGEICRAAQRFVRERYSVEAAWDVVGGDFQISRRIT